VNPRPADAISPRSGLARLSVSESELDRRSVLRAIVAGAMVAPVVAGCSEGPERSKDARARHPALAPPQNAVAVIVLDLRSVGSAGRAAALALLRRIDQMDKAAGDGDQNS
jgi:hypothetical protein